MCKHGRIGLHGQVPETQTAYAPRTWRKIIEKSTHPLRITMNCGFTTSGGHEGCLENFAVIIRMVHELGKPVESLHIAVLSEDIGKVHRLAREDGAPATTSTDGEIEYAPRPATAEGLGHLHDAVMLLAPNLTTLELYGAPWWPAVPMPKLMRAEWVPWPRAVDDYGVALASVLTASPALRSLTFHQLMHNTRVNFATTTAGSELWNTVARASLWSLKTSAQILHAIAPAIEQCPTLLRLEFTGRRCCSAMLKLHVWDDGLTMCKGIEEVREATATLLAKAATPDCLPALTCVVCPHITPDMPVGHRLLETGWHRNLFGTWSRNCARVERELFVADAQARAIADHPIIRDFIGTDVPVTAASAHMLLSQLGTDAPPEALACANAAIVRLPVYETTALTMRVAVARGDAPGTMHVGMLEDVASVLRTTEKAVAIPWTPDDNAEGAVLRAADGECTQVAQGVVRRCKTLTDLLATTSDRTVPCPFAPTIRSLGLLSVIARVAADRAVAEELLYTAQGLNVDPHTLRAIAVLYSNAPVADNEHEESAAKRACAE